MMMYSPPCPGEFIKETYLDPFEISQNEIAQKLDISPSTFNRLIRGQHGVSPDMAIRLSKVLGRSPESWMAMQNLYDLSLARLEDDRFSKLERYDFLKISNSHDKNQGSRL